MIMAWNANESTIKFHKACIEKDLETVYNLLRNDKEKIEVSKLNEMSTFLYKVERFRITVEKLPEAMEKDPNVEVIKGLCEIGVDLHQKDSYGRTALHMVCCGTKGFSVVKCQANQRIIEILLENGAPVHAKDIHGVTPLHGACLSGNIKIVKILLEHGASVHSKDYEGDTPLHMACGSGNLKVVQTLLQHHADVHAMNEI